MYEAVQTMVSSERFNDVLACNSEISSNSATVPSIRPPTSQEVAVDATTPYNLAYQVYL
jgi:hypothetical protein